MSKQDTKTYILGRLKTLNKELMVSIKDSDIEVQYETKTRISEVKNMASHFGIKIKQCEN